LALPKHRIVDFADRAGAGTVGLIADTADARDAEHPSENAEWHRVIAFRDGFENEGDSKIRVAPANQGGVVFATPNMVKAFKGVAERLHKASGERQRFALSVRHGERYADYLSTDERVECGYGVESATPRARPDP
jgi:hypothetical protein